MSKRAATDFDNSHTRISNLDDGDKGSGPVSGPSLSDPTIATSDISSLTVADLKAQLATLLLRRSRLGDDFMHRLHPTQPGMQMMAVNVPDGVMPGSVFNVSTPSGSVMAVTCPSTCKPGDLIQIAVPAGPAVTSELELTLGKEDLVRVGKVSKGEKFGNNNAFPDGNRVIGWYAGGYKNVFPVTGGSGTLIGWVQMRTDNVLKEPCTVQLVSPSGETLMSYEIAGRSKWWETSTVVPVLLSGQVYASCTTSVESTGCCTWKTTDSTTRVTRVDGSGGMLVAPLNTGFGTAYHTLNIIGLLLSMGFVGVICLCLAECTPITGRVTSLDGTAEYAPHGALTGGIKTANFVPDPKDKKRSSYMAYDTKAKVDALVGIVMSAVNTALLKTQYVEGAGF
ncbi:hypothetical protein TrLO_g7926 [Triparma laevis f. longispina]|uniref:Uncharacterized protein n=1 Tax=Triparma laevis f. longispina TaxID=1714387 RepID=A0A9W7FU48_9STRA|nr:hypothetical protein TrLO_g7926 [Triparma laevis f. longispina]